jgi:hypothetical protein
MRRLLVAVMALMCVNGVLQAESSRTSWLRRLTLAASCAASFWDLSTTRTASVRGALESNRYLADSRGNPQWSRIIGIKVGLCAGTGVMQELLQRRRPSNAQAYAWIATNSGVAAAFSAAAVHNRHVSGALKRQPAYMLKPVD